jgi:hypothetical protein
VSDNDNKWEQPAAPPPPLFTGQKERDIVKQVADEVIERVIGTSILYYPISVKHSDFHPLYGEAINKTYLPPIHVEVLAEWEGEETTTTGFGIDKQSKVTIHFHKRRLTEDQNLFVREGDFIQYGEQKYEIVKLAQPTLLFGQIDNKVEISAQCVRARDGTFPSESYPDPEEDDPRYTAAPACDPVEEIRVLTGDTTSTGGSGEQPCGQVYERPGTPPPPLFTGKKESNLVKQVNDELLERVVGQQVVYFPISVPHSDFHELYGEAINKTFLPPIRVFAAVSWEGSETTTTNYGIDRKSAIQVKFHKRRLTEDQNLFVREGDFVLYGKILYEIVKVGQPKLLFGKIDEKFEVVADCIRAREGTFRLSEVEGVVNEFDLDSVTACDNANLVIPDGVDNTMSNVGSGEGVFKNKTGINFNMKTLVEGENIVLTSDADTITISSAGEISGTITHAHTASYVETAQTASYVSAANIDGTVLSASHALTASYYAETDTLDSVLARGNTSGLAMTVSAMTASGVEIQGHIIPDQDEVYDIGSPTKQIRDLYVSTGSIVFGGTHKISVDPTSGGFMFDTPSEAPSFTNLTAAYVEAEDVNGLTELFQNTEATIQLQIDDLNTQISNIELGGGNGSITVAVAGIGSGIMMVTNDNGGAGSALLQEYAVNATSYSGKTLYLAESGEVPVAPFNIGRKFYFNEGGVWHPSHFFADEQQNVTQTLTHPDRHDILNLDGALAEDRAILVGLDQNALSYGGRAIYLSNVGDDPVGAFVQEQKYYFNEGGIWHASNFYSKEEEQ